MKKAFKSKLTLIGTQYGISDHLTVINCVSTLYNYKQIINIIVPDSFSRYTVALDAGIGEMMEYNKIITTIVIRSCSD
jgi:hypothetical protein